MENKKNFWQSPWTVMIIAGMMYIIKAALKLIVGNYVNSPALIADGYHNIADLIEVGLVMYFGIYLGHKPKSDEYPMGRKRLESILALGIGLALLWLTYDTFKNSLAGVLSIWPEIDTQMRVYFPFSLLPKVETPVITTAAFIGVLAATGISLMLSFIIGKYEIRVGKKNGMSSLVADGQETVSDGKVETASFLGFFAKFGLLFSLGSIFPYAIPKIGGFIEYFLGLTVAVLVLITAVEILSGCFKILLAKSIGKEKVATIKNIIQEIPGIRAIKEVTTFSDGHTATCIIKIETVASSKAYRPIQKALKKKICAYLATFEEFIAQEVYVEIQKPEPSFKRLAQAVIIDQQNRVMNAPTLQKATHLRIFDMDNEEHRLRASDINIENLSIEKILAIIKDKNAQDVFVFLGDETEKGLVELIGAQYKLNCFVRGYIPTTNERVII